MSLYQPIRHVPLWVLHAGTVLIVLLTVEAGIGWSATIVDVGSTSGRHEMAPYGSAT